MVTVGLDASHEQAPPSSLRTAVLAAEQAGFGAAMCSDHFAPWSERQGHSGNPWPWLGATLQATGLPMGDGLLRVDRGRLWSLPATPPLLLGAAVSEETARTAGLWADGLITVNQPLEQLRIVLDAFRELNDGRVAVQVHLSWAGTEDEALAIAYDQWRTNVFSSELAWNLETPAQFDAEGFAEHVLPELA